MAQKTFNDTKINVKFDEATSRQQLNSGENISTLFGKIKKIFSDLKAICFSGSYNDLSDTPTTATTDSDGLMSASDKSKLDSADDTYALKSKYGNTTINVGRKAGTDVGDYSHAEGYETTASRYASHAEGYYTTASGDYSHAEGLGTKADGTTSHAEGYYTTASGAYSHAGGLGTKALKEAEFAHGEYNQSNDDTLYSIGDGTADDARHNAFEITKTGGKLHDKDIATTNQIVNNNLLINPDFKINQRGETDFSVTYHQGTPISQSQKYTVDRWRIMDGEANISNGKYVLNGTIIQVLENSIGGNFTATVSVESGTADASYDDSTKTFSIVGNNAVLNWAKLEYGSNATQFFPPDTATELMKCMRYYEIIMSAGCDRAVPANLLPDLRAELDFQFKIPKRAIPSLAANTLRFVVTTSTGYSTLNLSVQQHASDINGMCLHTVDTVLAELPTNLLNVTVDTWQLGVFAVDAEIY